MAAFGSIFFILARKPQTKTAPAVPAVREAAGVPGD
jgi:hypothetical protein